MLNNIKQRRSEGFTIIEVMIVLAIAGLIMLIVFLAVPALQRNAHNTSIKNDVASLLGAVNEYTNNNAGVPPTTVSNGTTTSVNIGAAGLNVATAKLGYVDGTKVTLTKLTGTASAPTSSDTVLIRTNAICGAAAGTATATGATSRNYVALYLLEGGAKICQES